MSVSEKNDAEGSGPLAPSPDIAFPAKHDSPPPAVTLSDELHIAHVPQMEVLMMWTGDLVEFWVETSQGAPHSDRPRHSKLSGKKNLTD